MRDKALLSKELFFSRTSDYLDVFLTKQCNKSIKTRESYRDALTVFKRFVESTGRTILNFRYSDCTYEYLLDFKDYMNTKLMYAPSSSNHRLAAIKSYARYSAGCDSSLMQIYISIESVPMSNVPKKQREVLGSEDIGNLLDAPPATKKGLRDTLIMSVLFDTAIRLDELVQLKTGDIYHSEGCTYLLIHGKGNKERKISMDESTSQLLQRYMDEYHPGQPDPETPLIYTLYKGSVNTMSHRNVQKILKKYSEDLENYSVHPHLLRRSRASDLYQNDIPIELVSVYLGHSSIETTKSHYAFPSMEQMKAAMEAGRNPDAKREKPLWEGHEKELAALCGLR